MKKKLYDVNGNEKGEVALAENIFGVKVNEGLVHQLLSFELSNKRQGTADTKRRSEVAGSGAKPWRQKGTGRARAGQKSSPLWKGGGVVFGPHPRSYRKDMPKQMKRLAYCSLLSMRACNDDIFYVVEDFQIPSGRTKDFLNILLHFTKPEKERTVVVLGGDLKENQLIRRAGRNIMNLTMLDYWRLEVHDFFYARKILFTEDAVNRTNQFLDKRVR